MKSKWAFIGLAVFIAGFMVSCSKNTVTLSGGSPVKSSGIKSLAVCIDGSTDNSILKDNTLFMAQLGEKVCDALKSKNIIAYKVSEKDNDKPVDCSHVLILRSDGIVEKVGFTNNGQIYYYYEVRATGAVFSGDDPNNILCIANAYGDGRDGLGDYIARSPSAQLIVGQPQLDAIYTEVFVGMAKSLFSK